MPTENPTETEQLFKFKVTFKHGLQNTQYFWAKSPEQARQMGLVYHRKNAGFVDTVDNLPIDFVVNTVEQVA